MRYRAELIVLVLCVASLAGWGPVRSAEELLAPLLEPGDAVLRAVLPAPPVAPPADAAARADAAWRVWSEAVLARPPLQAPDRELWLAPVMRVDAGRHELVVAVPPGGVALDAPVTHRGVLLGFVRAWSDGGERVDRDGLARVALLGHGAARPVAAEWRAGPQALPVHFLLRGRGGTARVEEPDREFHAPSGEVAVTRDVAWLGDTLPAGLVLGELTAPESDQPGGGVGLEAPEPERVEPLLDCTRLGHVAVEVRTGATRPCRRLTAGLLSSDVAEGSRRLASGALAGVRPGDRVVQGPVFVGTVTSVGPFTAVVRVGAPDEPLLVVGGDGELVPATTDAAGWPAGWRPEPGATVFTGHRELGGLLVGTVGAVEAGGCSVVPAPVARDEAVTVIER